MQKLYEIRVFQGNQYSRSLSARLVDFHQSRRIVAFLKNRGREAFAAPLLIYRGEA